MPYYTLLVERTDIPSEDSARRLLAGVEKSLCRLNSEYQSKRETKRLGAVRLGWLPPGAWKEFCRKRLERSGGSLEQFKHPCLVNDCDFIAKMPVQGQLVADDASGRAVASLAAVDAPESGTEGRRSAS
jgi:hypothetical protein